MCSPCEFHFTVQLLAIYFVPHEICYILNKKKNVFARVCETHVIATISYRKSNPMKHLGTLSALC